MIEKLQFGQDLLQQGVITDAQLQDALDHQKKTGSQLGQILMAKGLIDYYQLDKYLAEKFNLEFIDLINTPPDLKYFNGKEINDYIKNKFLHVDEKNIVLSEPSQEKIKYIKEKNPNKVIKVCPTGQLMYFLHLNSKPYLSHSSVYALSETYPDYSAAKVFITGQIWAIYLFVSIFVFFIFYAPIPLFWTINLFFTGFLILSFVFKFYLAWIGSHPKSDHKIEEKDFVDLDDKLLPIYSILVPMYKEPEVLPHITKSLSNLNYPIEKLDIKLVLEENDLETINKAKSLNLPSNFEIILVPHSLPKTKPKACNYALNFTRGEYITIYDAEDRPEPNQLKMAIACFLKSSQNTAVVQARLNYFNPDENWITRMFTMEYSLWFDFFLPALEYLKVPIPLGGTSNHFKASVLKAIGGWDPFNVTEDADLGVRFYQLGYKVEVLNSTTFEEANTEYNNWIRQRSRWLKGYMQTYLVHMRNPYYLLRTIGLKGFLSFQFFIGGTFLTALIVPFLYLIFFTWFFSQTDFFYPLFTPNVLYLSTINLLLGNAFFIYIQMIGVFKRKYFSLIPYAVSAPFYWIMLSIAGFKGFYQLIFNPFYWEKTQHGLSKELKK